MTGLREKQKEKREAALIRTARTLFCERGYEQVKLEEIAERSDLSPRTLYSYFTTKNDLLLAVIIRDFELGFEQGQKIVDANAQDPLSAINSLSQCHFAMRDKGLTQEMWRHGIAAFLSDPDSHFAREYEICLGKVRKQFTQLIKKLQSSGLLLNSIYPAELAHILDSSATQLFLEFIRGPQTTIEHFHTQLYRMNSQIVGLARCT